MQRPVRNIIHIPTLWIFISADFTYHTVLDSPIPLIDAGHFYTENPVLKKIKKMIDKFPVEIVEYSAEEHEISNFKIV